MPFCTIYIAKLPALAYHTYTVYVKNVGNNILLLAKGERENMHTEATLGVLLLTETGFSALG